MVKKANGTQRYLRTYFKNKTFQRVMIAVITGILAFAVVQNGAAPKKYKLQLGQSSPYDITAPRDIENRLKAKELADKAAEAVPPVMVRLESVPIDTLNETDEIFSVVEETRKSIFQSLEDQNINKKDRNYKKKLELEQALGAERLEAGLVKYSIPLSFEQIKYLVAKIDDDGVSTFKKVSKDLLSSAMKQEITKDNLPSKVNELQNSIQKMELDQDAKNIGVILLKRIVRENSIIDIEMTEKKKKEAYASALEDRQIIQEGTRILSFGDIVTNDKLEVLNELKLLETGKFDYIFAAGILAVIMLLALLLILYMRFFCKKILQNRSDIILLSVIIILTLLAAWIVNMYEPLMMPVFIAPILISILLDLRLAVLVNLLLTIAISFITKGETSIIYVSLISGTFSAFIVSGASQRSRLSASGLLVALMNSIVVLCLGFLNKDTVTNVATECGMVALNGIISTIFAIGILPFFETTFNIITPLKLLELANPNHPLIKRLLMEAPGTYHHSLMVGNLAEVSAEAIDGNPLLARVGAYYHDVGKLKRPGFFKENQLSENPHDRMTANLSTLVITSHTGDGVDIANKYKLPMAIRDIINQHHGTTLAAYFFYKAKKSEKGDMVKQEDFRYQGPRPSSKEAAVVMLADSVEAAVRSMMDKTEGKIEGLIRKIIKDKLDDGQLDLCDLTLRDLDTIARSFMRVLGGFFHEREEYPEIRIKKSVRDEAKADEANNVIELQKHMAHDPLEELLVAKSERHQGLGGKNEGN